MVAVGETVEITTVEGRALSAPAIVRVLARGDWMLAVEVTMPAGAGSPPHRHGHESTGYVVRGRVASTIGGESRELGPGDGFCHPERVEHTMRALGGEAVWLEIKSPPEETW